MVRWGEVVKSEGRGGNKRDLRDCVRGLKRGSRGDAQGNEFELERFSRRLNRLGDCQRRANQIHASCWRRRPGWMGRPYSNDLRERVVKAIASGRTGVETAELHGVSLSTVGRLIRRKRETGSVSPDKLGGYKQHALTPHSDRVKELVAAQPDGTLLEYQTGLAKVKVKVSQAAIFRFLRHLNLSYKKKSCTPANKIGRTSPPPVKPCRRIKRPLIRNGWSSSTKPAPRPT
jgi:transposase